jgi:hypothetical protein
MNTLFAVPGMRFKDAYTSIERIVDSESTLLLCLMPYPSRLPGRPGIAMYVYRLILHSMTVLG